MSLKNLTLFVLVTTLLISCNGKRENEDGSIAANGIERLFQNFPNEQFEGLLLGEPVGEMMSLLQNKGYVEKPEQPGHYWNAAEEVEVVVADDLSLNSFKAFLFKENDRQQEGKLHTFLGKQAIDKNLGDQFSVYSYRTNATQQITFSLSVFSQPSFLRLNFQLVAKH